MSAVTVDAPADLYATDDSAISVRIGGQRRYDVDRREFTDAPDLTAGQAKQRVMVEHGDLAFTDYRVRKVWLREDPDMVDEETGWRGMWVRCDRGHPDAVAYWRVTWPGR